MSRNLPPIPEGTEPGRDWAKPGIERGPAGNQVILTFPDHIQRQWFAVWLTTGAAFEAYGTWLDGRRA